MLLDYVTWQIKIMTNIGIMLNTFSDRLDAPERPKGGAIEGVSSL